MKNRRRQPSEPPSECHCGPWTPAEICRRLRRVYGPIQPPPAEPVLDSLIRTVLSQHTSAAGCRAAWENLRRQFPTWQAVLRAPEAALVRVIRPAGLARQRAKTIRAILQHLQAQQTGLSLEFLHDWPTEKAWEYLLGFPGVGPKTAACVLLFGCGRPVLPVDTHVHRVARRLGLIPPKCSAAKAQELLGLQVPARWVLEFHLQLIRHGRQTCLAQRPRCTQCPLAPKCAFFLENGAS
jgi:endonuclease-3